MLLRRVSCLTIFSLIVGCIGLALPVQAKADNLLNFSDLSLPQLVAQNSDYQNNNRDKPLWIQELNLSQTQVDKMKEIRDRYQDQILDRQQAYNQAIQELRSLMSSTASKEIIRAKHQQVQSIKQQLEKLNFDSIMAIREILTPDQMRQFDDLMRKRRE